MFEWNVYHREHAIRDSIVLTRDMVIAARERRCDYKADSQEIQKLFANWNTITAWLDILGDTSAALCQFIDSYPENNVGAQYLYVYGAAQALSMQQDAAQSILKCFDINLASCQRLQDIRQIRIDLLHPGDIRRQQRSNEKRKIIENTMLGRFSLNDPTNLKVLYAHGRPEDEEHARNGLQTINLKQTILEHDKLLAIAFDKTGIFERLDIIQKPILNAAEAYDAATGYGRAASS